MQPIVATQPAGKARARRVSRARRREAIAGILWTSPWLLGFFLFTLGPILASFYLSFTEYTIASSPKWIGLANFAKALSGQDALFWPSLGRTFHYALIMVPLGIGGALLITSAEPAAPGDAGAPHLLLPAIAHARGRRGVDLELALSARFRSDQLAPLACPHPRAAVARGLGYRAWLADHHRLVGLARGGHDDHFPGRAAKRSPGAARSCRDRRRRSLDPIPSRHCADAEPDNSLQSRRWNRRCSPGLYRGDYRDERWAGLRHLVLHCSPLSEWLPGLRYGLCLGARLDLSGDCPRAHLDQRQPVEALGLLRGR